MARSTRSKIPRRRGYVLNIRTGTLHKLPSQERCNVDQVPRRYRLYLANDSDYWPQDPLECRFCFGKKKRVPAL